jgi:two-component system OmpR family response regulator
MSNFNPLHGRILVIEDEVDLMDAMVTYLNMEGFAADGVSSLNMATPWMRTHQFDVAVIDLGLPDGDGMAWLKENPLLQNKGVIITTARGESSQRIEGIKAGADVYLVKPIQLEELASLAHNLMRRIRAQATPSWILHRMNWQLNHPSGMPLKLTHSEFMFMQVMAEQSGQAVARQVLVTRLGHDPQTYDFRRLEILVRRLRNKSKEVLGSDLPLETVHKVGYAFTAPIGLA